jgi:hypothetical protein
MMRKRAAILETIDLDYRLKLISEEQVRVLTGLICNGH